MSELGESCPNSSKCPVNYSAEKADAVEVEKRFVRYFGSKASTVGDLLSHVQRLRGSGSFCDPFAGLGTVGRAFKKNGFSVTTGDHLSLPHAFQVATIQLNELVGFGMPEFDAISSEEMGRLLNCLKPDHGWFYEEFSVKRKFFTSYNAERISAAYEFLCDCHARKCFSKEQESTLIASLVDSMDRVANTAGTYYAYLKEFTIRARKCFDFRMLAPTEGPQSSAEYSDALDVVKGRHFDILYLDPPYNERDYSSYYHLPESMCKFEHPVPTGLSGIPSEGKKKSRFASKVTALDSLSQLISEASFEFLLFHYDNAGLISPEDVRSLLLNFGQVSIQPISCLGYGIKGRQRQSSQMIYVVTNG